MQSNKKLIKLMQPPITKFSEVVFLFIWLLCALNIIYLFVSYGFLNFEELSLLIIMIIFTIFQTLCLTIKKEIVLKESLIIINYFPAVINKKINFEDVIEIHMAKKEELTILERWWYGCHSNANLFEIETLNKNFYVYCKNNDEAIKLKEYLSELLNKAVE